MKAAVISALSALGALALASSGVACSSSPEDSGTAGGSQLSSSTASSSTGKIKPAYGSGTSGIVAFLQGWKWEDINTSLPALKAAGFTAIQLSPHTASCSGAYGGQGYDPSDYTSFSGGFGDEGDLSWLITATHGQGMQIYANMVMNNMCTHGDYSYNDFSYNDFHHNGPIQDFNNQWDCENEDLDGLNDLATESSYVQSQLWNFLVKSNNMGFDGYRWDAAKHIPQWFWSGNIVNNTNSWGKYSFGEVVSTDIGYLQGYVNTGMAVTDYNLYYAMTAAFTEGGDVSTLDGAGFAGVNNAMAATFIENNDVGAPSNRYLAMAFITGYPGYPFFYNVNLSDYQVTNLSWIHANKAYGAYINRWKSHDVLIFERQGNLIDGINQNGSSQSQWIDSSWQNTKLHDYTGHAPDVWTAGDGRVQITIPGVSYVMYAP